MSSRASWRPVRRSLRVELLSLLVVVTSLMSASPAAASVDYSYTHSTASGDPWLRAQPSASLRGDEYLYDDTEVLCYRSSCNGQDPEEMECANDARSLESFWYEGSSPWLQSTLLELRYSSACDAAWVRTTGGDCFDVWRPCVSALQVSGGEEQMGGPDGGQNWTRMWSFRYYVRGCFRSGVDLQLDGCTAWR